MPSRRDEAASLANAPLRGCSPPGAGSTHLLVEGLLPGQVGLLGWQAAQRGFLARQGGHEALRERGDGRQWGWGTHSARGAEVEAHSLCQASPFPATRSAGPGRLHGLEPTRASSPPVPKKGPAWQGALTCMP